MTWDFLFKCRGQAQKISGCTYFELNDQGLIILHRDYWDAAQQVYEKNPTAWFCYANDQAQTFSISTTVNCNSIRAPVACNSDC